MSRSSVDNSTEFPYAFDTKEVSVFLKVVDNSLMVVFLGGRFDMRARE